MANNSRDWFFGFANGVDALKREVDNLLYIHRPKLLKLEHESSPAANEAIYNFLAALESVDYPTEFPDDFEGDPLFDDEHPLELEF